MCGRFTLRTPLGQLVERFLFEMYEGELTPRFNIAPTQPVAAVRIVEPEARRQLCQLRWGLIPSWAKDRSIGNSLINARAETVFGKPLFRNAARRRRCLIPADGFYEWRGAPGRKQPVYISLPEDAPMAFAGLWEVWDDRGRAEAPLRSCTILTTAASPALREIHDRMPLILKPAAYRDWLDPQRQDPDLAQILAHHTHQTFRFWPVSTVVNAVRNNSPELIREV